MDQLNSLAGGDSLLTLAFIVLATGSVLMFTIGVGALVGTWRDPVRRRLAGVAGEPTTDTAARIRKLASALGPLGKTLLPGEGRERTRIERLLFLAGYRSRNAVATFYGIKGALALLLPTLWLAAARLLPTLQGKQVLFLAGCLFFVGMVLPNQFLERRVAKRQRALRNGFPDALDLLVICVEAGLGLAAAIERVAEELRFSHPELARELAVVNAEIRAGLDREAALRNLSERTGLADIRGLVSLLVQTLRFGSGVADTLRVFSEEFRDQRTQRAEEEAAKIGTKLIFPLIICEFPAFFVVAVGPAAIRLVEVFSSP